MASGELFDCGVAAGVRLDGLSSSETSGLLGFTHTQQPLAFTQNGVKRKNTHKISVLQAEENGLC